MDSSPTVPTEGSLKKRRDILRTACCQCLDQCLEVVQELPEEAYRREQSTGSSIGTHMRHIIERISCVLEGLTGGRVDYDQRDRDITLETSPEAATLALRGIQRTLLILEVDSGATLEVAETVHADSPVVAVPSTLDRELMSLVSHTVHHLAIISLLSTSAGYPLAIDIGKAPSTLLYERNRPQ